MQAITVSIPNNFDTAKFTLDRTELMRLESMGIITGKAYIYLALKLTYNTISVSIDTESFCDGWAASNLMNDSSEKCLQITESDLAITLGQLQKKGALTPVYRQTELELH